MSRDRRTSDWSVSDRRTLDWTTKALVPRAFSYLAGLRWGLPWVHLGFLRSAEVRLGMATLLGLIALALGFFDLMGFSPQGPAVSPGDSTFQTVEREVRDGVVRRRNRMLAVFVALTLGGFP